jgi:NitT/TauT family transport system ATP-binding protein
MSAARSVLQASGIALGYDHARPILSGFDLALAEGEIVSILGASGVGKSSILRVLAGLQRPSRGALHFEGAAISGVHPRVAIAFQNPGLLPWLTLERNVGFGLTFKRQQHLTADGRKARIGTAIAKVGLDHCRHYFPSALSGGMAQRAALARCLAREPRVLLLDEPFGALDEITRTEMQQLLLSVVRDIRTATALVTHDIDEALLLSDRIILLGGSPAREWAQWRIDVPHPREEHLAELGLIRVEIVQALRQAIARHDH